MEVLLPYWDVSFVRLNSGDRACALCVMSAACIRVNSCGSGRMGVVMRRLHLGACSTHCCSHFQGRGICPPYSDNNSHLSVKTDCPSGPYWLYRPSRSGVSYMLQIILWTNRDILDCPTILYTVSLYGIMLIIAIIILPLHRCMPLFSSFVPYCCMIRLFYRSADGPKPYSFYCV